MKVETNSMLAMSIRIKRSLPGFWTFTATLVSLPSTSTCATWTCAIVADASASVSNDLNTALTCLPPNSFRKIESILEAGTGGQSSKTDFNAATYCGGSKSDFVANTCPTLR